MQAGLLLPLFYLSITVPFEDRVEDAAVLYFAI
jgi:hypothetical protein